MLTTALGVLVGGAAVALAGAWVNRRYLARGVALELRLSDDCTTVFCEEERVLSRPSVVRYKATKIGLPRILDSNDPSADALTCNLGDPADPLPPRLVEGFIGGCCVKARQAQQSWPAAALRLTVLINIQDADRREEILKGIQPSHLRAFGVAVDRLEAVDPRVG